jgi:hypothetical protein
LLVYKNIPWAKLGQPQPDCTSGKDWWDWRWRRFLALHSSGLIRLLPDSQDMARVNIVMFYLSYGDAIWIRALHSFKIPKNSPLRNSTGWILALLHVK